MTMTFETDLDSVKVNQHARYLDQRSHSSKIIVRTHRHTHTQTHSDTVPIALLGSLEWSVKCPPQESNTRHTYIQFLFTVTTRL